MAPDPDYIRSPYLLSAGSARLLVIDVQEKLVPAIATNNPRLVDNCNCLIEAASLLSVPVTATEQYPAGLGPTVAQLREQLPECSEKKRFSAAEVLCWNRGDAEENQRHQIIVAGIEAHVCVMQTVLDLLAAGYQVHIPADAVASRFAIDRETALKRMSDCGATLTTTETAIFELCETAEAPQFKQISALIRQRGLRQPESQEPTT